MAKGTVRPGRLVLHQVLSQHPAQVLLVNDQQPVEDLVAQGADHPLADRVRPRSMRRADQDPDAIRGQHGVEGVGELAPGGP